MLNPITLFALMMVPTGFILVTSIIVAFTEKY